MSRLFFYNSAKVVPGSMLSRKCKKKLPKNLQCNTHCNVLVLDVRSSKRKFYPVKIRMAHLTPETTIATGILLREHVIGLSTSFPLPSLRSVKLLATFSSSTPATSCSSMLETALQCLLSRIFFSQTYETRSFPLYHWNQSQVESEWTFQLNFIVTMPVIKLNTFKFI